MGLVFTRKEGEAFVIGEGADMVTVTIAEINENQTKIDVDAPRDVSVDRREVRARKESGGNR